MSAANTYRRISPNQYSGAETRTSAVPMLARSRREPARLADTIPTPTPVTTHTMAPPMTSDSVAGRRLKISSLTGALL